MKTKVSRHKRIVNKPKWESYSIDEFDRGIISPSVGTEQLVFGLWVLEDSYKIRGDTGRIEEITPTILVRKEGLGLSNMGTMGWGFSGSGYIVRLVEAEFLKPLAEPLFVTKTKEMAISRAKAWMSQNKNASSIYTKWIQPGK